MSRKILKVLISLLFLAVAAVAALLGIKNFFPELFEQVKYGVKHIIGEPTKKTPAFKKHRPIAKYGVMPVQNPLSAEQQKQMEREIKMREQGEKYGVAPVRREPGKYGVAPVEMPPIIESKYGVAPVNGSTWQYEDKNIKN